ncbi:hypothetical protein Tco_1022795 [Tanacetum coccineum]
MFLNLDQLEKQLNKEEFQEIGSIAAFRGLETQLQKFIKSRTSLDDEDGIMTRKYFLEYAQLEVQQFRDTLIQHMESVKKSIYKRELHKREYDSKVNERQMQTKEGKVDTSKALNASLVDTESNGTEYGKHDTSNSLGNDIDVDDADIKPVYDEEPMAEFQKDFSKLEAHCINLELQLQNNVLKSEQQGQFLKAKSNGAKVKKDIDDLETINIELEHSVAKLLAENEQLNKEKEHLKHTYKNLYGSIKKTRVHTKDHNDSLVAQLNKKSIENADLKAQIQEKVFVNAALKNKLRKLKGNSLDTKFAKTSILGKQVLQPLKNQSVVRQSTAFKSERPKSSKPRFASQVDVNNDLSKPLTPHYLPKVQESAVVKPHHVIASSKSRNSSKNMTRFSSNDMVHNHYLEEARKKTPESGRNSIPSVMPSVRSQSTANDCKPKPRIDNQKSRNWPAFKNSCVTTKIVPIAEHSRNSKKISDSKHFVCSTCYKCVFNANHDSCVTKFLNEVNSRAKILVCA